MSVNFITPFIMCVCVCECAIQCDDDSMRNGNFIVFELSLMMMRSLIHMLNDTFFTPKTINYRSVNDDIDN